ncbi:MAG: type I restriction enzyme HsdR N-terminal domain-containing protein [candidate division SR1 bacterium]|nr:type I restriction enzyme HsdR N-terminal domain-containing protein [candidate division SR1 bacterium]
MDFILELNQHKNQLAHLRQFSLTEQATKQYLITPLLQILGYNLSDPSQVVPEFGADVRGRKGEKVDYAILQNGKPVILIECKHHTEDINNHLVQLHKYFIQCEEAKFAVVTNGIKYSFFTDLDNKNIMDKHPFLEIDLENLRPNQIEELRKFHKEVLNPENITSGAEDLKYVTKYKNLLSKELDNPSDDFIAYFTKQIYDGKTVTQKIKDLFKNYISDGNKQFQDELLTKNLNIAIKNNDNKANEELESSKLDKNIKENKIITTDEEKELFYMIKSIVRRNIDPEKVFYKDTQSYFNVNIDNMVTKWFVRVITQKKGYLIEVRNSDTGTESYKIEKTNDIFKLDKKIINSLSTLTII